MIDTRRSIETPEGVELGLHVAGPPVRAYAWLLDALLRGAAYAGVSLLLPWFGRFGIGILLIAFFLIEWFYPVLFEVWRQGATPGKKAMGIRVVHDDGTEIGWQASIIRNLLRTVDFLPVLYGFGLLSMALNRDFKRLGDLAAGTLVVYAEQSPGVTNVPVAEPLAPPLPLASAEQRAIVQFAERAATLSEARQIELAQTLRALTGEAGTAGVQRLFRYANWMIGRR